MAVPTALVCQETVTPVTTLNYHSPGSGTSAEGEQPAAKRPSDAVIVSDDSMKERLRAFDSLPLQNVVDLLVDVKANIAKMREDESFLEAYLQARMIADNAKLVHHPDYEKIAIEPDVVFDIDANGLYLALDALVSEGIIPEDARKKAVWIDRIPAQLVTKTHRARINDLLKYGDSVRNVIERHVRSIEGPPKLRMVRRKG